MTKSNGRLSATHCVNGHEKTPENIYTYRQAKNPSWPMHQCRACHRERRHDYYIAEKIRKYHQTKEGK